MNALKVSLVSCLLLAVLSGAAQAYEPIGVIDWVHQCGSVDRDTSQDMCGTPDGSFYITGWYENRYDPSIPYTSEPHDFGLRDIFLSKYSPQGELLWIRSAGSGHCDVSGAVASLPDGTCAITGAYGYGTASCTFGYGQPNQTTLIGIGRFDVCVAKYNGDGILQWAKRAGGPEPDYGDDIALAPDGSVYVAGDFGPSITFGHGLPNLTVLTNPEPGSTAFFLARYDTNGVFQWAQQERVLQIAALDDGTCIGATYPGVARYAADGTKIWSDETIATQYANVAAMTGNEFVIVYSLPSSGVRVARFHAENDGAVSEVWSFDVPDCSIYYASRISVRPDGVFSFCGFGGIYTVAADGSWINNGSIGVYPVALFAVPGAGYCYFTGGFYSDITVGGTTLIHKGNGDFFIARATNIEKYKITAHCENPGWIDFHQADANYWRGETATLTATPIFPGVYEFAEWGGDFAGLTDPELTFPVIEDVNLTAIFEHVDGAPELPVAGFGGLAVLAAALVATGVRARRH